LLYQTEWGVKAFNNDPRLFEPRYDLTSAARHLGMPRPTLSTWMKGRASFKRVLDLDTPGYLSFVNLAEAFVLFAIRRHYRITMPRIRDAIDDVEREMRVQHPLAFQHFVADKVDLFLRMALGDVNVSRRNQTRMSDVLAVSSASNGRDSGQSHFSLSYQRGTVECAGRFVSVRSSLSGARC
jgi:hypothetical protein